MIEKYVLRKCMYDIEFFGDLLDQITFYHALGYKNEQLGIKTSAEVFNGPYPGCMVNKIFGVDIVDRKYKGCEVIVK